jgi:hypothetical protein
MSRNSRCLGSRWLLSSILPKILECSHHFKVGFISSILDTINILGHQHTAERTTLSDETTTDIGENSDHSDHFPARVKSPATGLLSDDEKIDIAKPLLTNIPQTLTLPRFFSCAFDFMHNRFSHSLKEVNERASFIMHGIVDGPDSAQVVRHTLKLAVIDKAEINRRLVIVPK